MDVEANWGRGTGDDRSDDSSDASEWAGGKAGLQAKAEAGHSPPSSLDCCPAGPSSRQELPVELRCETEEAGGMHGRWTESATAGVCFASGANVDLRCEDEDPELRSSKFTKRASGRAGDREDVDVTETEDLPPAPGVVLLYLCKKRGESLHDLGRVQEHSEFHAAERSYQCPLCHKEFFRATNLRMHKLVHSSDRPYTCPECDKGFVCKLDFLRHLRNVHKAERPKASRSGSRGAESLGQLNQASEETASQVCMDDAGKERAAKPYLCPTCGKGFRTSNLLSKHKVIHRQDKPYECQACGKAFVELLRLKRHQQIHTGEHPFHCEECGGSFTRLSTLQRHQRIHSGEKPYSCAYCAQDFAEAGNLRRHERIHQLKTT